MLLQQQQQMLLHFQAASGMQGLPLMPGQVLGGGAASTGLLFGHRSSLCSSSSRRAWQYSWHYSSSSS